MWPIWNELEAKMEQSTEDKTEIGARPHVEQRPAGSEIEPITDIVVKLVGKEGNAFAILARIAAALRRGGRADLVECFLVEARSSDYRHLLRTCCRYCVCE